MWLRGLIIISLSVTTSLYQHNHDIKKRQTALTQHLNPAKNIDPIPNIPRVYLPRIGTQDISDIVEEARDTVSKLVRRFEPSLILSGIVLKPGSSAWFASLCAQSKITSKNTSMVALWAEEATKNLASKLRLKKEQVTYGLPKIDVRTSHLGQACPAYVDVPCQPRRYRSYNGHCNNVQNPHWGSASTPYMRFLSADYSDGISAPRKSYSGDFLPSPRKITLQVHSGNGVQHDYISAIFAYWGQFIAHDISHTPQASGFRSAKIKCCNIPFEKFHPECFPIAIPTNDPHFGQLKQTCMEYVRSSTAPQIGCTLGPREQINQVTSFLDASVIYGSAEDEVKKLRFYRNGWLKSTTTKANENLLQSNPDIQMCRSSKESCFRAGDERVNENSGIVLVHTLWMREHNRIATELHSINPHWNDEVLFQETRKIVGAELQHITYTSFLPVLLGNELMEKYGLNPQATGYFTGYDINMNPGVSNVVASAVFKFVIAMMPERFKLYNKDLKEVESMLFSETSFQPDDVLKTGKMDMYLRGLINQRAQNKDPYVSEEFTNKMFPDSTKVHGMDFVSMVLQQGRDHGIPSYTKWRTFCKLEPKIVDWNDLNRIMPLIVVESLKRIYKFVDDIDLFTGGLAEDVLNGASVGPTFACILGRQFHYLRLGDRYWYENDIPPSSFSKEKLEEIRKSSLVSLLCDNAKSINYIQPDVLHISDSFLNAYMSCHDKNYKSIDLYKWKTNAPKFALPRNVMENSVTQAKVQVERFLDVEKETFRNKIGLAARKSPEAIHYRFSQPKSLARRISNQSVFLEFTSSSLLDSMSPNMLQDSEVSSSEKMLELVSRLDTIDVSRLVDVPQSFTCEESTLPCDHTSLFRAHTGWCNNLQFPHYGKSMAIYSRILTPQYNDGLSEPRSLGANRKPLPSPRLVSMTVHYDVDAPHVRYSLMVMQFGQFLDHDLTMAPLSEGFEGSILDCKRCSSKDTVNKECYPIPIPEKDTFYPSINKTTGEPRCLSFTRSMPGQLTLGFRQQLNQLTAYIDSSNVYGSDKCDAKKLRLFSRGLLNTTASRFRGQKPLLPETNINHECKSPSGVCFDAGDSRASEQPGLTAIHTSFMREHNRIANRLWQENPHWNDEQIYQHGRRILAAMLQHITYKEFLPRILGWDHVYRYNLDLLPQGYSNDYDSNCKANILNEFSGAAFRFGHSLIKPSLPRYGEQYKKKAKDIPLRSAFFNSDIMYQIDTIDEILRGLVTSSMSSRDNSLTNEITNHLFEDKRVPFSGLDLGALNIQRGRDHGFPSYNQYRLYCNLTLARSFEDLAKEVPKDIIKRLKLIYSHVDDIDLFTGGLAESPLHGGLVGPTFGCIIGVQFKALRKCDRFWYEGNDPFIRFTESQLMEIRKVTLSKIICENSDTIKSIQRMSMDLPDEFLNPRISCKNLPSFNFKLWRERRSCNIGNTSISVGNADRISPCVMCTCTKEGPTCQSIQVNNCLHLAQNFPVNEILQDDICKVQCAHAFTLFPRIPSEGSSILGFSNS